MVQAIINTTRGRLGGRSETTGVGIVKRVGFKPEVKACGMYRVPTGYTFHYDLPKDSKIGGIGLFIKNTFQQQEICQFKINSTSTNRVENKWLVRKKYIIGGIYRHPNQSISDFMSNLEHVLNTILAQKLPCIIAGDINIDLTKCNTSNDTAAYVDCLFMHNCQPTVLLSLIHI